MIEKLEAILNSKVKNTSPLGGGCIANAQLLELEDGRKAFYKSGGQRGIFLKEANGLKEIAASNAIIVPQVMAVGDDFLLLEYIESGAKQPYFFEDFARDYAAMHAHTASTYGFYEDNFIGATPQLNRVEGAELNSWADFYFNKRLKFQFTLAERQGYVTSEMRKAFVTLEDNFHQIIGISDEPPSLLHGDLWGGNYMVASNGQAVLIDPAVYYGHREADLAMTKIFGGFSPEFYAAYQEAYPLEAGWEYRENIYKLYHILNHLNLFGSGYYQEALGLMEFYR